MTKKGKTTHLVVDVVEMKTNKIVHTVDCAGKSETSVDRVEMGMMMNMDRSRFFTRQRRVYSKRAKREEP